MIKRILFVCSGNICRSPMAKLLFEDMVNKDPVLRSAGIEVDSAGIIVSGAPVSQEAIAVAREYGLDYAGHRSKSLDARLLDRADLVLVMEPWHKEEAVRRAPTAADKTYTLSEYAGEGSDIPDPFGGSIEVYRHCAALLQSLLSRLADKLKR